MSRLDFFSISCMSLSVILQSGIMINQVIMINQLSRISQPPDLEKVLKNIPF